MKRVISFIFCALLMLAAAAAATTTLPVAAQTAKGEANAPAESTIKLKGVDGKTYDVADMRGEVVIVSFGATWCAPCAWELKAIEELKEEYAGKPVKFLWVSIEAEKDASNALLKHYAKSLRLTVPVLRDSTREAFAQFSDRVRIPMVIFFDRDGQFAAPAHHGMTKELIEYKIFMRRRIDQLLATQTSAVADAPKK